MSFFHARNKLREILSHIICVTGSYIKYLVILPIFFLMSCDSSDAPIIPFKTYLGYLAEGKPLDIHVKDEQNNEFSSKDFKGNVVIVVFSTTWCPNCPSVLKSFDDLHEKLRVKGIKKIKILALNVGNEDLNELKLHYKQHDIQVLDVYQSVSSDIMNGIRGVPACIIFDTKGEFVCGYLGGGIDFCAEEFVDFLKSVAQK